MDEKLTSKLNGKLTPELVDKLPPGLDKELILKLNEIFTKKHLEVLIKVINNNHIHNSKFPNDTRQILDLTDNGLIGAGDGCYDANPKGIKYCNWLFQNAPEYFNDQEKINFN